MKTDKDNPVAADEQIGKPLVDKNAEKYLKEGANIEDMPDAGEDEEAIKTEKTKK
jgi:hypothetical protein